MVEGIQQLTTAMAAGNADAVEAFYRQYFDWMYWQARRATGRDESFCLDVVQDAVLRVMRTVKGVKSEVQFRAWLRLVVQTTAFDLLRSERRRKNREAMAGTSQIEVDTDSLQLDWLQEQLARFDPELVKIIELRFEQSWTLRSIGQAMGISIGAVDGRLRRALKDLRLAAEQPPAPVEIVQITEVILEEPKVEKLQKLPPHELSDAVIELAAVDRHQADATALQSPLVEVQLAAHVSSLVVQKSPVALIEPVLVDLHHSASLPADFELLQETVEMLLPVEAPELIGLDDEAGAHDDRI